MTITSADIPGILEKHAKWIRGQDGGSRANLSRANLSRADLSGANLSRADLSRADLSGANLSGANLSRADLSGANLSGANLSRADLSRADLSGADLSGANLYGAKEADLAIAMTRILPEGDLIVYKKAISMGSNDVIVKLKIPSDAKRSHAFGRKCRAEFADVLEIIEPRGGAQDMARSKYDADFIYKVGERIKPKQGFDGNWQAECAPGIHFFITRAEAEAY